MKNIFWKKYSSFTYLNASQFLVTLNDSIFRLLVAYSLIDHLGTAYSNRILALSGALFVIPFLFFSMPAGDLADKMNKKKLIVWTMVAEIFAMVYGIFAIHYQDVIGTYLALFFVALQAAIFNPVKYAIIPELVERDKLSKVNGILTLFTYLAIILGTFFASFITQISNRNYSLVTAICLLLSIFSLYFSLQIENTIAKNPKKKINPLFFLEIFHSLKIAGKYPYLSVAVLGSSYFLFTAAYTQLNTIPFGIQSLNITDVQTGYVFLAAALGMGIGAVTVAIFSGKHVELGFSIVGGIGTAIAYILLYFTDTILGAVILILALGIFGGLYIVPLDAHIQVASPEKERGEIVAASSLLGFVGVLFAAGCIELFGVIFGLSAAEGFLFIGGMTTIVALMVTSLLPDYFMRLVSIFLSRLFFDLNITGTASFKIPSFIFCKNYSIISVMSLIQIYPKIRIAKILKKRPSKFTAAIFSFLHVIPIYQEYNGNEKFLELKKSMKQGFTVTFFLNKPLSHRAEDVFNINKILDEVLNTFNVPCIPVEIKKETASPDSISFFNFFKILSVHIDLKIGNRIKNCQNIKSIKASLV